MVANHISHKGRSLGGNLSYRKRERWISEIDLCLIKYQWLDVIKKLEVNQCIRGSDHAPLCVELNMGDRFVCESLLLERASNLGQTYYRPPVAHMFKKSNPYRAVRVQRFSTVMETHPPPQLVGNLSDVLGTGCDIIQMVSNECEKQNNEHDNEWDITNPRWKRLLNTNDSKVIWKAINWKGEVSRHDNVQPSDAEFKSHFEDLLNPEIQGEQVVADADLDDAPYIPLLDDPFTPQELEVAMRKINKNKSYNGICPGLVASVPLTWLMFLLNIFNMVFSGLFYPISWCHDKSGNKMDCGNYRGISIMDTLAKLYDLMILSRLQLWCFIDKCQAGAQKGRGCLEQIMTLRLIIDFALGKKEKLYVLFVDFSKAYDRVPRQKLISHLKSLGCGKVMLLAIKGIYKCTQNVLKSAIISSSIGVRQGAPTSCLLFVMYIDKMVKMIKETLPVDGFLGTLHCLLLMDDTVILATSRDMCKRKLDILFDFCNEYGMILNEKKSKFFVINGDDNDKLPFYSNNVEVQYCSKYLYLGAWFTDDGKTSSAISLHVAAMSALVNKFAIFCNANRDMPYLYKLRVFNAAVLSSLLYSSETWLTSNVKQVMSHYNQLVKCLLGVRKNTAINLCIVESGIPPMEFLLRKKRKIFLKEKLRSHDMDEPFTYVYELCKRHKTRGYKFIQKALDYDIVSDPIQPIRQLIRDKPETSTKYVTYRSILNTSLSVHNMYGTRTGCRIHFCRRPISQSQDAERTQCRTNIMPNEHNAERT